MILRALEKVIDLIKRLPRGIAWASAAVVVTVIASVCAAIYLTSAPAFLSRYHGLSPSYDSLQSSAHKNLPCSDCHSSQRGPVADELALVGDFYLGLFNKQNTQPVFTKLAAPTNAECLKCHSTDWSDDSSRTDKSADSTSSAYVPHPAHLRVAAETRACVTCHKWTAHEESYMQGHKKMPFSSVCASFPCHVGVKPPEACPTCHHILQNANGVWKQVHPQIVQTVGANACLETCHTADQCRTCHTTGKTPVFQGPAVQVGLQSIEVLHKKSDWLQMHGAQALLDQSKCFQCHVSDGECRACHSQRPAFHGPPPPDLTWIGTHKNFATDKRRCLECHQEQFCTNCHNQFKKEQ